MGTVTARLAFVAFLIFLMTAIVSAAPKADSVAYQARLTDNSGNGVADGSYSVVFSLWTDSTGGTQVWMEGQTITTASGLFSACLGCTTPISDAFADQQLWLQIQLGGSPPMAPRTKMLAVPQALTSVRVNGDLRTQPGQLLMQNDDSTYRVLAGAGGGGGGGAGGSIAIDESGVHRSLMLSDNDSTTMEMNPPEALSSKGKVKFKAGADLAKMCVTHSDPDSDDSLTIQSARKSVSIVLHDREGTEVMRSSISSDSASSSVSTVGDVDGDGVPENEASLIVTPTTSSVAIKTKGTGADKNRTISSHTDDSVAVTVIEADVDGDGAPDRVHSARCDDGSCTRISSFFDIFTELSISDSIDASSARTALAIKTKGTGTQRNGIGMMVGADTTTDLRCVSLNGLPPGSPVVGKIALSTSPSSSSVAIGDLDGDGRLDLLCSQDSSILEQTMRSSGGGGGSGELLSSCAVKISKADAGRSLSFFGQSSTNTVSDDCDDNDARHAINTKGTGAHAGRIVSVVSSTDSTSCNVVCAVDLDGDGNTDRQLSSSVDDTTAGIAIDEPGIQVGMGFRKGWDGTIKGRIDIENGVNRAIDLDADGNGFFAGKVGIGVDSPTHSIDVAGGAYCDGTNWTNASDANLKENFRPIDGDQLLAKVDELPISQWNYKREDRSVTHIGPTAQDFKAIFGVGKDSVSISTIDPSGIALAAIKELNRKSQQLEEKTARIDQLQSEIDQLNAIVKQLLEERK